ncbi:MAG: PaaI family thioesterase [Myxococcales bacterium]|nr:PaaI family thioesterase [Myxococcales bacterium]
MNGLETMTALLEGRLPIPPIARLIGFEMVEVAAGHAVFALDTDTKHQNPMGTLHGGVLCDLGDAAMGCVFVTDTAAAEIYTTLELKINFFKPVWKTRLTATADVVRRTRKLAYVEASIVDAQGSLVARINSSCLVLTGADAAGR